MEKQIKKNYILNTSYQILAIITPLITTPYVSRVLSPEGIGIYSYLSSMATMFVYFAGSGANLYGQREIAYYQKDKVKRSDTFWEVLCLKGVLTLIALVVYTSVICNSKYKIIGLIQILTIISGILDITWFYQGMEIFEDIVLRNVCVKAISIFLTFTLVKNAQDLYVYILILTGSIFAGNLCLWHRIPKLVDRKQISRVRVFQNFTVSFTLLIPSIAIKLSSLIDKIMLGGLGSTSVEVGYYEQAYKIITICLSIITSIGTVMMPRIASTYTADDRKKLNGYMELSYRFVWFTSVPLISGIISISDKFVPWLYGGQYASLPAIINILSGFIIIIGISNVTGIQYLIPTGRQNQFTYAVILSAVINIISNLIFIPIYGAIGAALGSLLAETVLLLYEQWSIKKDFSIWDIVKDAGNYLLAGGGMCFVLLGIKKWFSFKIPGTLMLMAIGVVIYLGILLFLKDSLIKSVLKVRKSRRQ